MYPLHHPPASGASYNSSTTSCAAVPGLMTLSGEGGNSWPLDDLIRACAKPGNQAAWEEFVRRVQPVIASTVYRTAQRFGNSSRDLLDDLIQETLLKVCANQFRILREFQADSPEAIFGLLKSVALSVVHDHFRSQLAAKRGSGKTDVVLEAYTGTEAADTSVAASVERRILMKEIDRFLSEMAPPVSPSEHRIFWLYYRHGLTARAIAEISGIDLSQKGVESAIHRLTVRVREWLVGTRGGQEMDNDRAKEKSAKVRSIGERINEPD